MPEVNTTSIIEYTRVLEVPRNNVIKSKVGFFRVHSWSIYEVQLPEKHGILEDGFKLPDYKLIQDGIRRSDLAVCNSMYEMNKNKAHTH